MLVRSPCSSVLLGLLCWGALGGCGSAMQSSRQLAQSARESSVAARFGQLNHAARFADTQARTAFLQRRAQWGDALRVVDVEVGRVELQNAERAEVTVHVAWTRVDEGLLRNSSILQSWESTDSGWRITEERRVGGDAGLFGDAPPPAEAAPPRDVHLPTRTLGTVSH